MTCADAVSVDITDPSLPVVVEELSPLRASAASAPPTAKTLVNKALAIVELY